MWQRLGVWEAPTTWHHLAYVQLWFPQYLQSVGLWLESCVPGNVCTGRHLRFILSVGSWRNGVKASYGNKTAMILSGKEIMLTGEKVRMGRWRTSPRNFVEYHQGQEQHHTDESFFLTSVSTQRSESYGSPRQEGVRDICFCVSMCLRHTCQDIFDTWT